MAFTAQSDKRTEIFYWRRQERGSSLLPLLWLERPLQADAMGGRCTGSSSRATHSLISQVCCSPGSGTFRSEASAVHGERRRHRALIPSSPVTLFHGHPRRRFNSHMLSVHSRESIQWKRRTHFRDARSIFFHGRAPSILGQQEIKLTHSIR